MNIPHSFRPLSALPLALAGLGLAHAAGPGSLMSGARPMAAFSEAELYFELNDSAGDLGIHSSIDGPPNSGVQVSDPLDRVILRISPSGRLARQGLTQLFFESAEPNFEELPPATFFARFPEGEYEITGRTLEGQRMEAEVQLSHVMAARPGNIMANGVAAVDCEETVYPIVTAPVFIDWDPVTASHPTVGKPGPVQIARYEFFAERPGVKLGTTLPPSITQFEIPADVVALGPGRIKYEIIARTVTGNNTAVEACVTLQ